MFNIFIVKKEGNSPAFMIFFGLRKFQRSSGSKMFTALIVASKPKLLVAEVFEAAVKGNVTVKVKEGFMV
jgi:hypothetical protein